MTNPVDVIEYFIFSFPHTKNDFLRICREFLIAH